MTFPLTSSSFFERRKWKHYKTHHSCYYRPDCLRCMIVAAFQILILAVRMKA